MQFAQTNLGVGKRRIQGLIAGKESDIKNIKICRPLLYNFLDSTVDVSRYKKKYMKLFGYF